MVKIVEDNVLVIYDQEKQELARHSLCHEKGKLIKNNNHSRDHSKGINRYIETVSALFSEPIRARILLDTIRTQKPRYIRDQLQSIQKSIANVDKLVVKKALDFCLKHKLFNATEFVDAVNHFKKNQASKEVPHEDNPSEINPIDEVNRSKLKTKPQIRDIKTYQYILKGGNTCQKQPQS